MPISIATWNINSVRLRIGLVERFLLDHKPDMLCLQEIKCQNEQFPARKFRELGYEHIAVHGQKGYHGVATVSRFPLLDCKSRDYCDVGDTRHLATTIRVDGTDMQVHNFYVPAGGDEPDPEINPKFRHKLDFLEEMKALDCEYDDRQNILVGDLNVAPHENDVWSHKQLLKIVSHTPIETDTLDHIRDQGRWVDLIREKIPLEEKVFSWWSYRAREWEVSNRGRRLDHIWAAPGIAENLSSIAIVRAARSWEKPSDHIPLIATFEPKS